MVGAFLFGNEGGRGLPSLVRAFKPTLVSKAVVLLRCRVKWRLGGTEELTAALMSDPKHVAFEAANRNRQAVHGRTARAVSKGRSQELS
jgi:hypothetical protein